MTHSLSRDAQITWAYTYDVPSFHAFYGDTLQLSCVLERGGCRIYHLTGQAYLGICEAGGARGVEPRGTLVTVVTDDVDAWYARLTEHGVETDGPPCALPDYGIYAFFATGPDGYRFEFQRFDDDDWNKNRP